MTEQSDAEVLCEFMQGFDPRITSTPGCWIDNLHWWTQRHRVGKWEFAPRLLDLDACHEIEAKLTDEQWAAYGLSLAEAMQAPERHFARKLIHASAEQKVKALAAILRGK